MYRVTFTSYAPTLRRTFTNVEQFRSMADAELRAKALNWQITHVERV